jgi:hypothetical protein
MAFAQLIEYTTSNPDKTKQVLDAWEEQAAGKRTARRALLMKHHDDGNRYCELVFFDSFESAMENSELPETQEFARKLRDTIDGEPSYVNFDVVEEKKL